jgi:uncharacterized SAM-binding protein YcdF (DUF218 family)
VLLVSQAWHLPRAQAAFEREGVAVTPAPTAFIHRRGARHRQEADDDGFPRAWLPQARAFWYSTLAVHEFLGQVYYRLRALLGGMNE